jgi:ABC-type Zn2+ transport system substrate-binding protein/surface adhesin
MYGRLTNNGFEFDDEEDDDDDDDEDEEEEDDEDDEDEDDEEEEDEEEKRVVRPGSINDFFDKHRFIYRFIVIIVLYNVTRYIYCAIKCVI